VTEVVAAIDCGTNTIKLLVGALPDVAVRETRLVRLGQGVDATGRLADDALERTFAALDEYAALIREHGATRIRFCATSATRDAENAAVFTEGVRARLGLTPDVLSGASYQLLAITVAGVAGVLFTGGPASIASVISIDRAEPRLSVRNARPARQ